jgi:hypothetical protein
MSTAKGRRARVRRIEVPDEPELGPGDARGDRELAGDVEPDEVGVAVAVEITRGALVDPAAHPIGRAHDEVRAERRQRDRPRRPAGDGAHAHVLVVDGVEVLGEAPGVFRARLDRLRPEARHDDGRGYGDGEEDENDKAPLAR